MLAKNRRENLLPHVKEARKLVEDAFDRVLVGLGLPKDREPLPPERITNPDKLATRKAVDEVIARDREAGGMSYVDARRRYLEHCSFTLVNRVAALRAMEIRGFLTKSVIAQDVQYGGVSAWARDIVEAGTVEILGESIPIRTADEARWQAIRAACVAASRDVAIVFDLQDEYSALVPEPAAIKGLVVELTEMVTADDWAADDILGWVYQYYNVSANADYKERKKRRGYKMSADDMIVANQFYTPHWVVRVLVDNTLGRIWWESIPDLARKRLGEKESDEGLRQEEERLRQVCRETCSYLVPLPDEQRLGWWGEEARSNAEARAVAEARKRFDAAAIKPEGGPIPAPPGVPPRSWKPVRELKIIDPACGSAHFLLYVFDVLRRMYEIEPKSDRPEAAEVPNLILAENLHGIDVDLRACQLGTFNLYLKARLAFREITGRDAFHPSKLNIVCAGARITEGEARAELLASFDSTPLARELAEGILNNLSKTAEIGSLLKVREQFEPLLRRQRHILGKHVQPSLFGGAPSYQRDFLTDREIEELSLPQVLDRLKTFESEARPRGDVGRLLFAHEMAKSCGMVDLLTHSYDVALMNPPYGSMPEACKDYCRGNRKRRIIAHYPASGNNLYSAFIERCLDLITDDSFIGMLTSQTFMYLSTFKHTRFKILNQSCLIELLCDTGFDVLDGAKVVTSTVVLRKRTPPDREKECLAIRLFQDKEDQKEQVFREVIHALVHGRWHTRLFPISISLFANLPQSVYSYWVPEKVANLFHSYPPIDRDHAGKQDAEKLSDVKMGLGTGDNPQFVRFYWELSVDQIASTKDDTFNGRPWVPYALGGWLDSFYSDIDNVVMWRNDGELLKGLSSSAVRNDSFYFEPGICWHRAPQYPSNQTRMNARLMPIGTIPTIAVNAIYTKLPESYELMGYLNSQFIFYMLRIFDIRMMLAGAVGELPYPIQHDLSHVGRCARSITAMKIALRSLDETSPCFVSPSVILATRGAPWPEYPVHHVHSSLLRLPLQDGDRLHSSEASTVLENFFGCNERPVASLRQLAMHSWERRVSMIESIKELEDAIDDSIYLIFNIDASERTMISGEIAFRQCLPIPSENEEGEVDDPAPTIDDVSSEFTDPIESPVSLSVEHFLNDEVIRLICYAVKFAVESDDDGIVPLVPTKGKSTLSDRVKHLFGKWFGTESRDARWDEAARILSKPVENWLSQDYFNFHVNMYRRRPIFWQLTSAGCLPRGSLPGAFSCLLHYHKLRGNTFQNILAHYLVDVLETAEAQFNATKTVFEGLQQRGARRREINDAHSSFQVADRQYRELIEFRRRIQDLDTGARPVTPAPGPDAPWLKQKIAEVTGGPAYGRGWLPVLDYGVRVNIEPLKVAGILPRAADRIE